MNPTHKTYTFASRTSPDTNQSLQKSMLFPTLKKNKKSPPLKKNKTFPTHNPTDKNGMTELIDYYNGMSLDKKEGQLVTCGIFYCRVSAVINGCGSLQTSSWLDSDVLRNRQQKHTAKTLPPMLKGKTEDTHKQTITYMDFKDQIKILGERVAKLKDQIQTEEATKNAFIMPFLQALGYDVFNPTEVVPEFVSDIGLKKGEKIDYAIFLEGKPTILVECKHWAQNLNLHDGQLLRYFHVSKAKFGLLTDYSGQSVPLIPL